jgi:hypothetical protein
MLVRKLTSETLSSDKSVTIDIIKKYFGKNTELSQELNLYNSLLKEHRFKTEASAYEYIRMIKSAHDKINQNSLRRQRYNLVKEISEKFKFEDISKIHINNYKVLASINMIFEHAESDNPLQLMECKRVIASNTLLTENTNIKKDSVIEKFQTQSKDMRLLTYKLLVDKFNEKYSGLTEDQKHLLNKYVTNVNDTTMLREYVQKIIPNIKKQLFAEAKRIDDKVVKIKVEKLSEMLCNVENIKVIKESHILSLLRYFDLIKELKEIHA